MEQTLYGILCALALVIGVFLTAKPEKATFGKQPTKTVIRNVRIAGIVILVLFAAAAFAFFMAWKEGQLTL